MAVLKCKMCGGDLEVTADVAFATCKYCGSKQTIPSANDDLIQNLFNRANHLRIKCEFDKAAQVYEKILQTDDSEAEAHWGLVLCKYGIEYVQDPKTGARIPTCHRTSYDAVAADADYLAAIKYAAPYQGELYEAEAKAFDVIQKNILNIVKNEKPFDVFLCYKETDEYGRRTVDSAIANDIYHQLTQEGFKVFYAAITLEDKLGQEYEPYIFAALNSAKVMLVIGTEPQYFTATWVKNEWSRFLKLISTHPDKLLIPCYRNMDAYDLPEEFAHLQAQDMSRIGFINDIVRGIRKVLSATTTTTVVREAAGNSAVAPLLKRAFMFLEDRDWESADEYCEKVLDADPENAQAYLGKLMAELHVTKQELLRDLPDPFDQSNNFAKAIRFGNEKLRKSLEDDNAYIIARNKDTIYNQAQAELLRNTEFSCHSAAQIFDTIPGWKDADSQATRARERAEEIHNDTIYNDAVTLQKKNTEVDYQRAAKLFDSIPGWRDAKEQADICRKKAESLDKDKTYTLAKSFMQEKTIVAYKEAIKEFSSIPGWRDADTLRQQAANAIAARHRKLVTTIGGAAAAILLLILVAYTSIPRIRYKSAMKYLENGETMRALSIFMDLGDLKDSKEQTAKLTQRKTIAAGVEHTLLLQDDSTVVAVGSNDSNQCNVSEWTDIVAIAAGYNHSLGLKSDGAVVAVGSNGNGRCDVSGWTDIVTIAAGCNHSLGLKSDGTVVAVGTNSNNQCNVSEWTDIVSIAAGGYHSLGLKIDGTVVAVGSNYHNQCDVDSWTDIVAIAAGYNHSLGLKKDGTVVAVGNNSSGKQCNVTDWTDIVAIAAGRYHSLGLKSDGTVVAVGLNGNGRCDVSDWTDIVAIAASDNYSLGLKSDGTVVAVGSNDNGLCNVADFRNIMLPKK